MNDELMMRARSWLFDRALPFWASAGIDRTNGGCVESFALNGAAPSGVDFKRTRVLCRQVYVFSHAAHLGWEPARDACDFLFATLLDKHWLGPQQGWACRLTTAGDVLDLTPDLYDYAFALFALGWRHKAFGDPDALTVAHQTLDLIHERFSHPTHEGFHHILPPALPRQQNPHMHLIEAALVLAESSGDARFRSAADEIAQLFGTRLARFPEGVLPEFFDDEWRPITKGQGQQVEPGHQFEWAWILAQHQKLFGAEHTDKVRALVTFAERHGVDPQTSVTINGVDERGQPLNRGTRIWPNTERIKGWIGLYDLTGIDPTAQIEGSLRVLLNNHLEPAPNGCWIESFDEAGVPKADVIPTSSLYHLFLAFAEAMRVADTLAKTEKAGALA